MSDNVPDSPVLGRTIDECLLPAPAPRQPAPRRPNIVLWLMDDVGYGHLSPYGGLIDMPALQRVVDRGMRFSNAHATPLCSPTRACLLTGRNHHSNHMPSIPRWTSGIARHDANIPRANGFLSEILVRAGYATMCIGKWHLTPISALNPASSRNAWPLGRGFERFYGFLAGQTSQYDPHLVVDNSPIYPPRTSSDDYHLSEDLVDVGLRYVKELRAGDLEKPFFMYLAFGASHAPHHAPKAWIDRFRGRFDMGWDEYRGLVHANQQRLGLVPEGSPLSVRDPDVPAWESLDRGQQQVAARLMEAFAGMTAHMDHHVGRLLDELGAMGELENTIVIAMSDNGASSEGGTYGAFNNQQFQGTGRLEQITATLEDLDAVGSRDAYNHFPWGWAWSGNTPFRRWKRETYRGGCAVPFVMSWPERFAEHGNRDGFVHVIDVMPTMLALLGIDAPESIAGAVQSPIEGISFAGQLADQAAPSRHTVQYYEILGHRALHHDGWRAVCPWPGTSWKEGGRGWSAELLAKDLDRLEQSGWELYDVRVDPGEVVNLASRDPERLRNMVSMWWHEAGRYGVLPMLGRAPRPQRAPGAESPRRYTYYPDTAPVFIEAAADVVNVNYVMRAELDLARAGVSGMVLAHGGKFGGYGLFVLEGRPRFVYSYLGLTETVFEANRMLPAGPCALTFAFEKTAPPDGAKGYGAPGIGRLYIDGEEVASGVLEKTAPVMLNFSGSLTCGYHHAEPFSGYTPPFRFEGLIRRVDVWSHGTRTVDEALAREVYLKRQ